MPDALLKEVVPQEFRDRPYLKDLLEKPQSAETFAEVFKKLDGAEKLVGKKTVGIPEGDKQEDWDAFLTKLRPGRPEEYEVKAQQGQKVDEEFARDLRDAFHHSGIHPKQAGLFQDKMLASIAKRQAIQVAAQKKLDDDFVLVAKTALGDENKAVLARAKKAIDEFAPGNLKTYLPKLDNNSLVILAGVVDSIIRKYTTEDNLKPDSNGGDKNGNLSAREQAKQLMGTKEFTDQFHPKHAETVAKVQALYQEAGKK